MMETVKEYAVYASIGVAGLVAFLNVVAPLTRTEWDNRALKMLRWMEENVLRMLVPQARETSAVANS
jgi:hypothetical protein